MRVGAAASRWVAAAYASAAVYANVRVAAEGSPRSRPAATRLTASRTTSHSNGTGSASS